MFENAICEMAANSLSLDVLKWNFNWTFLLAMIATIIILGLLLLIWFTFNLNMDQQ